MPLRDFSTAGLVVVINGITITDWGEAATPYNDQQIDPATTLVRGQGGNATRLDRINPGRNQTLALSPGSPNSLAMQALFNARAPMVCGVTQIGTLEFSAGDEGVMTSDGSVGRGGTSITDDIYTIEYNTWITSKGGV
jgi:hypothetical protein